MDSSTNKHKNINKPKKVKNQKSSDPQKKGGGGGVGARVHCHLV